MKGLPACARASTSSEQRRRPFHHPDLAPNDPSLPFLPPPTTSAQHVANARLRHECVLAFVLRLPRVGTRPRRRQPSMTDPSSSPAHLVLLDLPVPVLRPARCHRTRPRSNVRRTPPFDRPLCPRANPFPDGRPSPPCLPSDALLFSRARRHRPRAHVRPQGPDGQHPRVQDRVGCDPDVPRPQGDAQDDPRPDGRHRSDQRRKLDPARD